MLHPRLSLFKTFRKWSAARTEGGKKLGEREGMREEGTLVPYPRPSLFYYSHLACVATRDKSLLVMSISYRNIACVASVRSPHNLNTCNRSPSAGIMQNSGNYFFSTNGCLITWMQTKNSLYIKCRLKFNSANMSNFVQTSNFTHFACLIHSTLESNVYWSLTFSDDFIVLCFI